MSKTETVSARYATLDLWPTADAVEAMFEAQVSAAAAVRSATGAIAGAAEAAADRLRHSQGRLIYVGAGTSGRIAVQDGVELGPTFDWPEARLLYLLAGGEQAITTSVEDAEDNTEDGRKRVLDAKANMHDVVIGVAASGQTRFTLAAVEEARKLGALTIGIAGNADTPLLAAAEHAVLLPTGEEVIAGSTRMKAGTAQKIALNLFSTAVMLRLGRVHGNLMVAMRSSNKKLVQRALGIVQAIAGSSTETAKAALIQTEGDIRTAVLVARGLSLEDARAELNAAHGVLRQALAQRK